MISSHSMHLSILEGRLVYRGYRPVTFILYIIRIVEEKRKIQQDKKKTTNPMTVILIDPFGMGMRVRTQATGHFFENQEMSCEIRRSSKLYFTIKPTSNG